MLIFNINTRFRQGHFTDFIVTEVTLRNIGQLNQYQIQQCVYGILDPMQVFP